MNICAGEPVDESMFVDGRANNSRGGEGYNATKFDEFWTQWVLNAKGNMSDYHWKSLKPTTTHTVAGII